jgi:hypothetical protein
VGTSSWLGHWLEAGSVYRGSSAGISAGSGSTRYLDPAVNHEPRIVLALSPSLAAIPGPAKCHWSSSDGEVTPASARVLSLVVVRVLITTNSGSFDVTTPSVGAQIRSY